MYWFEQNIYNTIPHKISKLWWWWQIACALPCPTLPAIICWQWPNRVHQDGYHVDGADCCVIGIVLGVTMKNIPQQQYYPISANIAQYPVTQYQYRSNPQYNFQLCKWMHYDQISQQQLSFLLIMWKCRLQRRERGLKSKGLLYVGSGVSGGEDGARYGPSLMPGGSADAWYDLIYKFHHNCNYQVTW